MQQIKTTKAGQNFTYGNKGIKNPPNKNLISGDMYPVDKEIKLIAYSIDCSSKTVYTKLLNQVSYRLGTFTKHIWANSQGILITEASKVNPNDFLQELWELPGNDFDDIQRFNILQNWQQEATHTADYVCKIFNNLPSKMEEIERNGVVMKRKWYAKPMVAEKKPYLAIEVSSNIYTKLPLSHFNLNDSELLGLDVKDLFGFTKGIIVEVIGTLGDHRERLLSLSKNDKQKKQLIRSSDNTRVVKLKTRTSFIPDYSLDGVCAIPRPEMLELFGINQKDVRSFQLLKPNERRDIISSAISKSRLKRYLGEAINSNNSTITRTAGDVDYNGLLKFGSGATDKISNCFPTLRRNGFYRVLEQYENTPVRIGILDMINDKSSISKFESTLQNTIRGLSFDCEFVARESICSSDFGLMERAIRKLSNESVDIILGIIPDNGNDAWNSCKHLTINKGIMNQMVLRSTVQNPQFKVDNLALQILSKLGNVPWVLNKPLPFCDVIMGADIARQKKRNGKGTRNEMGIPRWFEPNGDLLKYRLVQSSIDGERIPMNIIRECTPVERFGEKNILFHLDGKRGVSEVQDFLKRGNEINAEIMVVEVIKLPPFRIYQMGVQQTEAPNKGQWIRISNNEAVVVSTTATHQIGTPRPLHLKCTSNISIEDAVLSVLALSDLNYASKQQARCPITTHSSHNISKMLLNDIRPPVDEGTNPWWL